MSAPYHLPHGSPLSDAQAVQIITRAAQGEALDFAPVRSGAAWVLLHLGTLTPCERAAFTRRVQLAAQFLDGAASSKPLTA